MNRFFTLLFAASCLTAVGQEDCVDVSSTFDFSALYLEADYYAADSILYYYVRFYPNGMGEYWQLDPASTLGVLSFEYALCEQNGNIFYTDSFLYEAQVNANGVFEGTTNTGELFTFTPVREGSPFETETNTCGWQPDGNGDNLIGVNDLLDLLGVYGDTDYDQDDIWDSVDDCVGEYDECGVCNGSGPSIPIIENIEILYDSLYAEQIDEWWVFEVGADTTYQYVCGLGCTDPLAENYNELADTDDGSCVYPWICGDPLEYQGYDYETVQIGEQCWFAENLRAENYRNGDAIPSSLGELDWNNTTAGAVAVYGEGSTSCASNSPNGNACDEMWSLSEYGRLYNWYAVEDGRGLCPTSWKVPTNECWMTLELHLGISPLEVENGGWRGSQEAVFMKDSEGWYNGGNGDNSSGLTIKPAGVRASGTQGFMTAGEWAMLWSSSLIEEEIAINRYLNTNEDRIAFDVNAKRFGFSVRCIKD